MATTTRGAHRRQQLVGAASAILEESGFAAVTHRAVAARAGLPLAATTYYFASRDDLIDAALDALGAPFLEQARAFADALAPGERMPLDMASIVVRLVAGTAVTAEPARLLTFYERYVQAGRHERLRGRVHGWTAELARLVAEALTRGGWPSDDNLPLLLVALTDGLLLDGLIDGDAHAPARAVAGVASMLARIAGRAGAAESAPPPPLPSESSADRI